MNAPLLALLAATAIAPQLGAYEHVVSVSGGKDSTATYLRAMEVGRPFKARFADTGNEHERTYDFVRDLARKTGGPEVEWVKADLSHRVLHKRDVVLTKWVSEGVPDDIIQRALNVLVPTGNPFLDLCLWKGRFPSTKHRFCTEFLKVQPIIDQVYEPIWSTKRRVVSWQGVRKDESFARSLLPKVQRMADLGGPVLAYRPILDWTVADVFAMHAKHGIAPNPLYAAGWSRVGCMPCINEQKTGILLLATKAPEHVAKILEWEALTSEASKRGCATFFATANDPTVDPNEAIHHKTHGLGRMIEWAKTDRGGRQTNLLTHVEFNTPCSQWGSCEGVS